MRYLVKLICLIFIFSFLFSCTKRKLNRSTTTSQEYAVAEILFSDIYKIIEETIKIEGLEKTYFAASDFYNNCASISVNPSFPDTSFPKTITIDYGNINCTDLNGINRRGKIIAIFSNSFRIILAPLKAGRKNLLLNLERTTTIAS